LKITNNHPIKVRKFLGPLGRLMLKIINWDIIGNLPDKKRIIIASAPHSSIFDGIYAYFVCLALDVKFYFLGSVSMFTRIVIPLPFKKNPDKLGIPHPLGKMQNKLLLEFGGIPVWRAKSTGVTQQVIDQLQSKDKFILYLTVEGEMKSNETIKTGFYYIGKALDATVVPTKIDYKNRRFELMDELVLTDSVDADKNALMERYHLVQGRNKIFYKPGEE
jgi:1-acyl-sn-glycerol-3-phosphate acyltransferase